MTRKEWLFFLLACCFKLGLAVLIHPGSPEGSFTTAGAVAVRGGDTFSYLDPVENLLRHGTYAQDLARPETYAGRMPGYGLVYGTLRLLASPRGAADGTVLLQLLLSLVALYCLARLAQTVTRRPNAFQWTAVLYGINTFTTVFDIRLLSESFATSALIIGVYSLGRAHRQQAAGWLLSAGGWLAWMVFLRPFLGPLLVLLVGAYVVAARWQQPRPPWRQLAKHAALLLLPFLVADSIWLARNWQWYHRPVPLQSDAWAGYKTAPGFRKLGGFMGIIGEEQTWWNQPSDVAWFYQPTAGPNFRHEPGKLAPPAYTYDSLNLVRTRLVTARDSTLPLATRRAAEARANQALVRYTEAYRRLRPFHAFLLSPAKLAYRLVLAHPTDLWFRQPYAELTTPWKAAKIAGLLWYLLLVGLGLVGTLLVGWRQQLETWLVKAVPLHLLVLLCLVMRQVESRYFAVAYPFVVIGAVQLVLTFREFIRRKRGGAMAE